MAEENTGVQGQQGSAADGNDVTFTDEQQAHVDSLIADRLSRADKANEQKTQKALADKGFTADDETLKFVVRETADDTTQAVTDFAKLVDDKAEAKRQESLRGNTPTNAGAGQNQGKSFGAQMAEKSNSRSLSGVADDFFGTKAK